MTFVLYAIPYLNRYSGCYSTIITLDKYPQGPLRPFVRRFQYPLLSPFRTFNGCSATNECKLAIHASSLTTSCCDSDCFVALDKIGELYAFLMSHNYHIDTKVSKLVLGTPVNDNAGHILGLVTYLGQ